jgi:hypothetical protein
MKHFPAYINRLSKINDRINQRNTGPAEKFAAELNISVRTLHTDIDNLKYLTGGDECAITYSTAHKSYLYSCGKKFHMEFGFRDE